PSCCAACLLCSRDPAPTRTYTLSLHDALPIYSTGQACRDGVHCGREPGARVGRCVAGQCVPQVREVVLAGGDRAGGDAGQLVAQDRKSTRLNSSHVKISYAVFCLKKKRTSMSS